MPTNIKGKQRSNIPHVHDSQVATPQNILIFQFCRVVLSFSMCRQLQENKPGTSKLVACLDKLDKQVKTGYQASRWFGKNFGVGVLGQASWNFHAYPLNLAKLRLENKVCLLDGSIDVITYIQLGILH